MQCFAIYLVLQTDTRENEEVENPTRVLYWPQDTSDG